MPDYNNKRCPQCGGAIDYFGSCRRCGREWTDKLEEDELAEGLPEGQQHPAEVKTPAKKRTRTKYTKNSTKNYEPDDPYALWQITDQDDETEIIKKRSLMRLDSRKTYNQMGLALRAHEAQKASLLWLSRLWEFLSEAEQQALAQTLEFLKRGYADLKLVAQSKVNEAAKMELELDKSTNPHAEHVCVSWTRRSAGKRQLRKCRFNRVKTPRVMESQTSRTLARRIWSSFLTKTYSNSLKRNWLTSTRRRLCGNAVKRWQMTPTGMTPRTNKSAYLTAFIGDKHGRRETTLQAQPQR